MGRYREEKTVQAAYQLQRQTILEGLAGLPFIFDRDAMVWDVERYTAAHSVSLETAIAKVRAAATKVGRQYHEELAAHREHQHVWIKRTADGFTCISCPALGTWNGDDNTPMEETTNAG